MSDYKSATSILEEAYQSMLNPKPQPKKEETKTLEEGCGCGDSFKKDYKGEEKKKKKVMKENEDYTPRFGSKFNSIVADILGDRSPLINEEDEVDYEEEGGMGPEAGYEDEYTEDDVVTIPRALADELLTYLSDPVKSNDTEVDDVDFEELEESMSGDYSGKPSQGKDHMKDNVQKGSHFQKSAATGKVSNSGKVHIGGSETRTGSPKELAKALRAQIQQTGSHNISSKSGNVGKRPLNND